MPIKEFTCPVCGHEHEELVGVNAREAPCPKCSSNSQQVFRTAPRIDWMAMGAQANVSPEFIDRFEKVHREGAEKEKKAQAD